MEKFARVAPGITEKGLTRSAAEAFFRTPS
jgi:uncharacterized small protein (DUF1192 family)